MYGGIEMGWKLPWSNSSDEIEKDYPPEQIEKNFQKARAATINEQFQGKRGL
jgi:hypothetical protein